MTVWAPTVIVLAGLNLVRLLPWRASIAVGSAAAAAVAVVLASDGSGFTWRLPLATVVASLIIGLWRPMCLGAHRGRRVTGLAISALLFALLIRLGGETHDPVSPLWPLLAGGLLLAEPTTRLLRLILGLAGKSIEPAGPFGRGEAIGVLERWIVMIMIVRGEYAAMAFIVAAKALARHKLLDDPEFAEYFLVGTLASLFAAILVAESIRFLAL